MNISWHGWQAGWVVWLLLLLMMMMMKKKQKMMMIIAKMMVMMMMLLMAMIYILDGVDPNFLAILVWIDTAHLTPIVDHCGRVARKELWEIELQILASFSTHASSAA